MSSLARGCANLLSNSFHIGMDPNRYGVGFEKRGGGGGFPKVLVLKSVGSESFGLKSFGLEKCWVQKVLVSKNVVGIPWVPFSSHP